MFEQETEDAVRVIGCSTSEIASHRIGSYSNVELGEAVFLAMYHAFRR